MTDPINPIDEETRAIDLIARSPEGHLLHRYLRRVLESCAVFPHDGALREHNGRRTLARDLMAIMANGIADTARTDAGRTASSDTAILTSPGRGTRVAGRRSAGSRRVAREPDDGWGEFGDGGSAPGTSSDTANGNASGNTGSGPAAT